MNLRTLLISAFGFQFSAFSLFAQDPPADTGTTRQLVNPTPKNCCDCIDVTIATQKVENKAGKDPAPAAKETNGDFLLKELSVNVRASSEGVFSCDEVKIISIDLIPFHVFGLFNPVNVYKAPVGGGIKHWPKEDPKESGQDFKDTPIPASNVWAQEKSTWLVVVTCSGAAQVEQGTTSPLDGACIKPFVLGTGCSSCDSAAGTCGPDCSNGSFTYDLPIGSANAGDTTGILRFYTADLTNPGPAGLAAYVPSSYVVNRNTSTKVIESIVTPTTIIGVTPLVDEGSPVISRSFTITHTHNGETLPFRTTQITQFGINTSDPSDDILRADSIFDGTTTRHQQTRTINGATTTYTLETGSFIAPAAFTPLRTETLAITPNTSAGIETHLATITEEGTVVSSIQSTYTVFPWGWEKTREVIDPGSAPHANLVSTWSYYGAGETTGPAASGNSGATDGYGMLKNHTRYDGNQETHTYWLNTHETKLPFAADPQGLILTRAWNNNTLTTTRKTATGTLSEETSTYNSAAPSITSTVQTGTGAPLVTTTTLYPFGADFGGQPKTVTHPDGTLTTYSYTRHSDGGKTVITATGSGSGNTVAKGRKTTTTTNRYGTVIRSLTETIGYTANIVTSHSAVTSVDDFGRELETAHFPTTSSAPDSAVQASATGPQWTTSQSYSCCGIKSSTDMHGDTTHYAYDDLRRQIKTNTRGVTTQTTHHGLTSETRRYPEGVSGTLSTTLNTSNTTLVGKTTRNLAGTSTTSESPDPSSTTAGALTSTTTATTYAGGLTSQTTTIPGVGSQTTISYPDGRIWKTTGTLAPSMEHAYSVTPTGPLSAQAYLDGTTYKEITATQTDLAGRTTATGHLSTLTSTIILHPSFFYYNSLGQLEKSIDADNVLTLFAYNDIGEREITALSLNGNATIDYGIDQVNLTKTAPATRGVAPAATTVMRTETFVVKDKVGETIPEPTRVSYSDRTPSGLDSWSWQIGTTGETHTTTNVGMNRTQTTTRPDGTYTTTAYSGRLPQTVTHYGSDDTVVTVVTYDYESDLKRPWKQTDSRTGTTTTAYISTTCDAVLSVSDPGNRETKFTYDARGNRLKVNAPDTTAGNNETDTTYDSYGRVETVSGATYPVSYTYDYAGRQKTMTTTGDAGDAITAWNYDSATGQLLSKRYDSDLSGVTGSGPDYDYTPGGRLWHRKWARLIDPENNLSPRVLTTYGYTAGLLTSVTYNDGTPSVSYNYDAFPADNHHLPGTLETVTQAGQTWTHKYDPTTFRLLSETSPLDGTATTRKLTRASDPYGRPGGFTLGTSTDIDSDHTVAYGYDSAGRLDAVTGAGKVFGYGYAYSQPTATDPRVGDADGTKHDVMPYRITSPVHAVTRTYEATRDALAAIENKVAAPTISAYGYAVNPLGQRESLTTTGSAFGDVNRGWTWGYDSLGQVTSAAHSADTTLNRAYTFDTIGNRLSATDGSGGTATTTGYTPNPLNQYQEINRGTPVAPGYDLDGNLRSDAGINTLGYGLKFEWDGENRLTTVRKATDDALLVSYTYDYLSRRIRRTSTTSAAGGAADTAYIYDGWNCIAEYQLHNSSFNLHTCYTWGLDLSGSLQGAGGVGGLLCIHREPGADTNGDRTWSADFYPTYDGNGNVSEYLGWLADADPDITGDQPGYGSVAHFEYDPFGRIAHSTGNTGLFTYQFSTKPIDSATGWNYYAYRYYDPLNGRWPSRDPIEEMGGVNLFGFVENDSINNFDFLGMASDLYDYWKKTCSTCCLVDIQIKWIGFEGAVKGREATMKHRFDLIALYEPKGKKLPDGRECDPDLCVFEQYVKGEVEINGKILPWFKGGNKVAVYADRWSPEGYSGEDRDPSKTRYYSWDTPGVQLSDFKENIVKVRFWMNFYAEVKDSNSGVVLGKRFYRVKASGIKSGQAYMSYNDGHWGFYPESYIEDMVF